MLQDMGEYAPGEAITDADAQACLAKLNDMVDSWSNESLTIYASLSQSFTLVQGKQNYTIGPVLPGPLTPDWVGVRPLKIRTDPGTCYVTDTNGDNYQVDVIGQEQFNMIGNNVNLTSDFPDSLFYNPTYPWGTIWLSPIPSINYPISFICDLVISEFASIYASVVLPPGYKTALQSSLLLECWPMFKADGSNPSQTQVRNAQMHKAAIKRTNMKPLRSIFDSAIIARGSGVYNIYTDQGR